MQYVLSAARQSPRLFEIILILGYQLRVDDCVPAEQCLWKTHELNRKRPVSAIHNIDLDVFLDSHIPVILELHPGREPKLLLFFERLKISDVHVWTDGISFNWFGVW